MTTATKGLGSKQRAVLEVLDTRWQPTISVAHSLYIEDEIGIRSVRRALDQLHTKRHLIDKEISGDSGTIEARWRIRPTEAPKLVEADRPQRPKAKPTKRPAKKPA